MINLADISERNVRVISATLNLQLYTDRYTSVCTDQTAILHAQHGSSVYMYELEHRALASSTDKFQHFFDNECKMKKEISSAFATLFHSLVNLVAYFVLILPLNCLFHVLPGVSLQFLFFVFSLGIFLLFTLLFSFSFSFVLLFLFLYLRSQLSPFSTAIILFSYI